jgi:hypothetical protein
MRQMFVARQQILDKQQLGKSSRGTVFCAAIVEMLLLGQFVATS